MAALEKLTTRINIEMAGDTKRYLVSAKQGDKATRYIIAKLFNDGVEYTIPAGARVAFNVEKPDGKHVYNRCAYSGSDVTVELTNQTLSTAGTAYCDIEVRTSDNAQIITSASFTIEIEKSVRNDNAILSANEFTELEDRIAGNIKNLNDTEKAVKKAEEARVTAENGRVIAENLRQRDTEEAVKSAQNAVAATEEAMEELKKQVGDYKEEIADTIQNSLIASAEHILDSVKSYFERAEALYQSMYFECDGETPSQRAVSPIFIDGATPAVRNMDIGIDFDGGTPTSRLLAV